MQPIRNPYALLADHQCFGCCPSHSIGLKLSFFVDEEWVVTYWKPDALLTGYKNVIHGGIQSTLMDEVAAWVVYVKVGTAGVTSRMEVRYRKAVLVSNNKLTIRGKVVEANRRIAKIHVEILDEALQICAEALVEYFLYTPEKAVAEFDYPGVEAFFDK
jgi:uncharacterized protein (TIGR00369 family)